MRATVLKLATRIALCYAVLVLALCVAFLTYSPKPTPSFSEEPYRMVSPSGGVAPHPAVMLVPGCSGFATHNGINVYDERAAELQEAGYIVIYVDYIRRRMQSSCAHVLQTEVSADILEAATWAQHQPGIDAKRISVIGWSYGGGGVLAALKAMPRDALITKAVMYYPVCRGAMPWSTNVSGLMLLGAMDEVASPALCDAVVKQMAPDKLRMVTYANARHGFDMRGRPERADHISGASVYNAEAAKASWTAALDFLK